MIRPTLKLGTRGSLLAVTQSQQIADLLAPHLAGRTIELVRISTAGDRASDRPLQAEGGKGLFVTDIEDALRAGTIDFAVHSAKDLPMGDPPGLVIAATPPRADPRDVWIGHNHLTIAQLPPGATVGTASLRRGAQLLMLRRDLNVIPFRGNIDTRLKKVAAGDVHGTFLAAAGLIRAGLLPAHAVPLPVTDFVPAAGQGILAIQARADDPIMLPLLAHINDAATRAALDFERHIVAALAGNCLAPIGVCAQPRLDPATHSPLPGWIARAIVALPDGSDAARATLMDQTTAPPLQTLAPLLLDTLRKRGAAAILAAAPTAPPPSIPRPSDPA
jgi:hydroxymethylbilane synthase